MSSGRNVPTISPVDHHDQSVAHLEQLIEIFGNKQNRRASGAVLKEKISRCDGGGHIHATGWVETDQQSRISGKLPGQDDPLHIATRKISDLAPSGGVRNPKFCNANGCAIARHSNVPTYPPSPNSVSVRAESCFQARSSSERCRAGAGLLARVTPCFSACAGDQCVASIPITRIEPATWCCKPTQLAEFALPVYPTPRRPRPLRLKRSSA